MAQRITTAGVMIEYTPPDMRRFTTAGVMVEYTDPDFRRITTAGVMIEYTAAPQPKHGVILQVGTR